MASLFGVSCDFDDDIFRNITGVLKEGSPFDDLGDSHDWDHAEAAISRQAAAQLATVNNIAYQAIDYVFEQTEWLPSRFGDGTFPIWYGSNNLKTTFAETAYHWRMNLLGDMELDTIDLSVPIVTRRSVFQVHCRSLLVDFRDQVGDHPYLVQQKIDQYDRTQWLGRRLSTEGHPGLLTLSARCSQGENIAVLNKQVLSRPQLHGSFNYVFYGHQTPIDVINSEGKKVICVS